jgi:probable phosphoglycerate mutase
MNDRPTRLIVVRHAEPSGGAQSRCHGSLDHGLSTVGRAQARALAQKLRETEIAAVVASPIGRALDTAQEITRHLGLPVVVDDDLRELEFGELEGLRYEEIERTMPALYAQWMTAPTTVTFPGGESFTELRTRARAACTRIRADHAGATVALVTHDGVCRAILADVLKLSPAHTSSASTWATPAWRSSTGLATSR